MYGSHKEIYFQPLKVCVATINTGLFYFMPLQFECCFESTKVLSLHTNGDDIIHFNVQDKLSTYEDSVISVSLHYEEVMLLIKEIEKRIQQIKVNNIKKKCK